MTIPNLIRWCESAPDSAPWMALRGGDEDGAPRGERRQRPRRSAPDAGNVLPASMSGIAPADEAGLLQRICVDDEVAFEYTYLEVYGPLREFAYALTRDDAVAHDIVQDVLFTFWRDRARLDIRDRFVPYLYKAVRNQCAKRWRHHRVVRAFQTTSESEDAAPGMSAAPPSVDDAIERTELHTALMAAVEQLSERQRAVVTLYLTGTMSATEIGDVLGLAPSAVLMNLSRARTTLRAVLMQFVR